MGPTNQALLRLFEADKALREAKERLTAATRAVRTQEAKVRQLGLDHEAAHKLALQLTAKSADLELQLKTREERIELLRSKQSNATNQREYQALLIEINTQKTDRAKVEEQTIAALDAAEKQRKHEASLKQQLESETTRLAQMKAEIDDRVRKLTADVGTAQTPRDEAASAVPGKALEVFERLAERTDGLEDDVMVPIEKPRPKVEQYICGSCNLELTVDIYNRACTRDEPCLCPCTAKLLYIPAHLTPDKAINKKKVTTPREPKPGAKPRKGRKGEGAPMTTEVATNEVAAANAGLVARERSLLTAGVIEEPPIQSSVTARVEVVDDAPAPAAIDSPAATEEPSTAPVEATSVATSDESTSN